MQKKQRRAGTSSQGVNRRRSRCYVFDCETLKCPTFSFNFQNRVLSYSLFGLGVMNFL